MKTEFCLQAIKDGFLVGLYLISIWIIIFSPLGVFLPVYITIILDLVLAVVYSYYYYKTINKISTKNQRIVFSLISFVCFLVVICIFFISKIYFQFNIIPKKETTSGDGLWAIFDGIVFLFTLFIGRFIAFMSADNG